MTTSPNIRTPRLTSDGAGDVRSDGGRPRLLSVIPVMGVGGAEVVAATLARDAQAHGYDVTLASAGGFRADELAGGTAGHGVAQLALPLDSRRPADLARSVARLRAHVRREAPELVHAHNVKAAVVARLAVGRSVPVLTTLHGVPDGELAVAARLLRHATDRLVVVAPHLAETVADHGFPADRVTVIENAVLAPPARPRDEARARLGLAPDTVVGLCLARLAEQKRHDLLVQAWDRLERPGVLLIAGDGPTRERVSARVEASPHTPGLRDIRLLGAREDSDWLLAAADYLVLPTDWEGLPISVLEAMSLGVPVLASRVGGVLETLGSAIDLVTPGSVTALADGLDRITTDPQLRARLAADGRTLVADRFRPATMLARYRAAYATLAPATVASAGAGERR